MTESEYLRLKDKAAKAPKGNRIKWQMRLREAVHKQLKNEIRATRKQAA